MEKKSTTSRTTPILSPHTPLAKPHPKLIQHQLLLGLAVVLLAVLAFVSIYLLSRPLGKTGPKKDELALLAQPTIGDMVGLFLPSDNPLTNLVNAVVTAETPVGMVWIPPGTFWMGEAHEQAFHDARPVHEVELAGYWMDRTEVTNAQFARFVLATDYQTIAEQTPTAEDFPNVPKDKLKPFSLIFTSPPKEKKIESYQDWWRIEYGACWHHPDGPTSTCRGLENHPATHISYIDAVAYCKWAGKRLPTEAEWERAARGGLDRKRFVWGDEFKPKDVWQANIWQGKFPYENTKEDGYVGTAPVGSFPPNGFGLYDMSGNVWEWCSDWYRPDYYEKSPRKNPLGPDASYDPQEPNVPKRVQRGGSILCCDQYCIRYLPGGRGKGEVTSGQSHAGFRAVRSAK